MPQQQQQQQKLYLSRRNLLTLLSKLDRKAAGGETECSLIKRDTEHPVYPQTMSMCLVQATLDLYEVVTVREHIDNGVELLRFNRKFLQDLINGLDASLTGMHSGWYHGLFLGIVEDNKYYADREPGKVHEKDEPK